MRTRILGGAEVPLTAEQEAVLDAEEAAWADGEAERTKTSHNAPILAQIAALEAKAHRAMRECMLGSADVLDLVLGRTPKQHVQMLEDQIATLRGQLLK